MRKRALSHQGECIYLLNAAGSVKVGYSRNVDNRIRQMQTSCAHKIELIRAWYDSRARKIERMAHDALAPYRQKGGGEWFDVAPSFAIMVIEQSFQQLPCNPAIKPMPKLLLVCKTCGHGAIVPDVAAKFRCSQCNNSRSIRFFAFPRLANDLNVVADNNH